MVLLDFRFLDTFLRLFSFRNLAIFLGTLWGLLNLPARKESVP